MNFDVAYIDGITAVSLKGEIHGRNAAALQEKLLPLVKAAQHTVLDMTRVTYLSSAGLRLLLLLYREVEARSGKIILIGLNEMIRDTMSITGFLDFFEDYPSLEEGIHALRSEL